MTAGVFISWSGSRGRAVAECLRENLPLCLNNVDPWCSSVDINAGRLWFEGIQEALEKSVAGIVVLTEASLQSPWVFFEAGYLFARAGTRVIPYLSGITTADIKSTPLGLFQACETTQNGTLRLLTALNTELALRDLSNRSLDAGFAYFWPRLEACLRQASAVPDQKNGPGLSAATGRGVAIAVVQREHDFLMTRRRTPAGDLTWGFPAVMLKPEQRTLPQMHAAVVENVRAETGVAAKVIGHLGSRAGFLPGDTQVLDYYHCEHLHGEPTNLDPEENSEVRWVAASDVMRYVTTDVFGPVQKLVQSATTPPTGYPVVVGVVVHDGRILAVCRTEQDEGLTWALPGGKVLPGEPERGALVREIAQETGIVCDVDRQIGGRLHPTTSVNIAYYLCRYVEGELTVDPAESIARAEWLTPAEFESRVTTPLHPAVQELLDALRTP